MPRSATRTAGHDLYLIGGGVVLGLMFGVGAGTFTLVYLGDKGIYAKAGRSRRRFGRSASRPALAQRVATVGWT